MPKIAANNGGIQPRSIGNARSERRRPSVAIGSAVMFVGIKFDECMSRYEPQPSDTSAAVGSRAVSDANNGSALNRNRPGDRFHNTHRDRL